MRLALGSRLRCALLIACASLALPGCKDEGEERLAAARSRYETLVREGKSPRDPAFEQVREKLRSIPPSSDAHAEAQKLLAALDPTRTLPPRPLATATRNRTDGGAPTMAAVCEKLAIDLGRAPDAAERERLTASLAECRKALEREHATGHPPGEADPHPEH